MSEDLQKSDEHTTSTNTAQSECNALLSIIVCEGVMGPSIYINDYRICGPKPWGGGKTLYSFKTTKEKLLKAINKL